MAYESYVFGVVPVLSSVWVVSEGYCESCIGYSEVRYSSGNGC